ncbi:PAS-domain containing protein [Falsirhodobacter sp. 20TX0035]|uniref:PAS-domain containing protein n=1 Tax=Falsirhodobacter sp. 20TX0035 TaxID=3022019 RepID=UPI00232CF9C8|nr:PAS-domain containing protein [Falsirhodobacter sp. 20TX0035]MDB6452785.1 PAS-domain containing protein [Falsirhodobacter sp. 20TX0035]
MPIGWIDLLRAEAVALLACAGGFVVLDTLRRRAAATPADGGSVFLFDGDRLIDCSPSARLLLAALDAEPPEARRRLQEHLAHHLPDLTDRLTQLDREGRVQMTSPSGLTVEASLHGGITRIALDSDAPGQDALTQAAQSAEIARLRRIVQHAQTPLWEEGTAGEVTWANPAYVRAAGASAPQWPLPHLFPQDGPVNLASGWMHAMRQAQVGTAWPLDRAVLAEAQLREFRQTLARTFADLPIGLAIFDRQRLLQIFNPALMDLTGLPPDMLSSRPSLFSVLDALRERALIPEPKDYRHWRKQMIDLEEAATHGRFEETWNLPGGQTWRVVGRPHPDGAMALLFEDISGEMTRTRRYRADLELGQSVIDAMTEGVAVFSPSGTLVISNAAYARMWDDDPGTIVAEVGIGTLCARWRAATAPSPLWAEVEHFAVTLGPRTGGQGTLHLLDGRRMECRFTALPGGATLVGFQMHEAAQKVARYG